VQVPEAGEAVVTQRDASNDKLIKRSTLGSSESLVEYLAQQCEPLVALGEARHVISAHPTVW
jgi:hypothetical protein